MRHKGQSEYSELTPELQAYQALQETLRRAAESDGDWPRASTYVGHLDLFVLVDARGILLRGPMAQAVAASLETESSGWVTTVEVEVEVDPQPLTACINSTIA